MDIQLQAGIGNDKMPVSSGIAAIGGQLAAMSTGSDYVEAMSNLAFDRSIGASDDLSQYGVSAYQAQVNAYQRLLGIGGALSAGTGGVNIIIENVTINGADASDPVDLANKFDEAISDKIKRGTSEIPPALKAAGL